MDKKRKIILGQKRQSRFIWEKRKQIVEEYLSSSFAKRAI